MALGLSSFESVTGTEDFVCNGATYQAVADSTTTEQEKSPGYYTPEDSAFVLVGISQLSPAPSIPKRAKCTWRGSSWLVDRIVKGQYAWTFHLTPAKKRDGAT